MQVGEPGAHVVAGVPAVAAGPRQVGADLAPQQPGRDGRVLGDADPGDAVAGPGELAAADRQAGGLQLQEGGLAPVLVLLEERHQLVGAAQQRRARRALGDLGEDRHGVGAHGLRLAAGGAEPAGGALATRAGLGRVVAQQGAGRA